ncbi:Endonuclease III-like protein 1 [Halocaridina rubra]|uniref:Endonuclease III homolog n=1 Tax=Halocaridina rubra TaxID=373956 RepID=A0AAN9A103_HALRR
MAKKSEYFSNFSPMKTRSRRLGDGVEGKYDCHQMSVKGKSRNVNETDVKQELKEPPYTASRKVTSRKKIKICYEEVNSVPSHSSFQSQNDERYYAVKTEGHETDKANGALEIKPGQLGWEPPNWQEVLENIRMMRSMRDAPVDQMGAEKCPDKESCPEVYRFQVLISLMLSSQTKDQITHAAMTKLRAHGLTVQNILDTSDEVFGQLIYPVGFWKKKITYIKKTCTILKEQYNSDIPPTLQEMCKLPGVGPKMAHLCMDIAWGKLTGVGVDTHVHRISNRLGWTGRTTKTPENTRKALEAWMPESIWSETNLLMVGFGQQICLPVGPLCHQCLNNKLCPYGTGNRSPLKRSPSKNQVKKESLI